MQRHATVLPDPDGRVGVGSVEPPRRRAYAPGHTRSEEPTLTEPPTELLPRTPSGGGWSPRAWVLTVVVAVVLAVLTYFLVSTLVRGDGGTVDASRTGGPTSAVGTAAAPAPGTTGAPAPGDTTSAPRTAAPARTTARATTAAPTTQAPGPRIVSFRVKTDPACPAGTNQAPIAGRDVTLEWEVTGGATGVEIAVDGPGKYGDFAAKGELTLSFPCTGEPNTQQVHTYTLTTVGGGPAVTRTLTVTARVNEIPVVP
jgi:hypothetical protein